VPVYFPDPVRDRKSGLDVPNPGCVNLDPVQALAYARSRAFEYHEDGRWHVDGTGDLGRISRQQDFIRRVLHRAFQRGARNPLVLRNLLDVGVHAITLDGDLTLDDLRELGTRFREFNPDDLLTYGLPVYDDVEDGAAVLKLDNRAAQRTLDVFRGEDPSRVAPDNTVVIIQNGTSETGLGQDAAEGLRALGFVVPPDQTFEADSFDVAETTVYYTRGNEARAALLASALGVDPVVDDFPLIVGGDVSVLIGADWQGVAPELRAETPGLVPVPPAATTTTTRPGATTSTTQVIGEVPEQPTTGC
jgi:hypothetical protein